jgi:intracellular septation protein A
MPQIFQIISLLLFINGCIAYGSHQEQIAAAGLMIAAGLFAIAASWSLGKSKVVRMVANPTTSVAPAATATNS